MIPNSSHHLPQTGAVTRARRLAIVSPFLDKSHGTERMVIEWMHFLRNHYEIHVYSQEIVNIDLSGIIWHRIPKLKGPHLSNFLWWFVANQARRKWDRFRGLRYDLTFSPGVNCLDADIVSIHIVFAEFRRRVHAELALRGKPLSSWPRLIHRRLYYRLIMFLEGIVFTNPRVQLVLTAPQTAEELKRFYGRSGNFPLVLAGLDLQTFNPQRRLALRTEARVALGIGEGTCALLLIGNDWRKKGLFALLDALRSLGNQPLELLVVGRDDPQQFRAAVAERGLQQRIRFLPPRTDVEFYYAAADMYVGPSIEDTFALPISEAMACGIPVIASSRAGAATLIANGIDGLVLDDPTNSQALAKLINRVYEDTELGAMLGQNAAKKVRPYSWEWSSGQMAAVFEEQLRRCGRLQNRRDDGETDAVVRAH